MSMCMKNGITYDIIKEMSPWGLVPMPAEGAAFSSGVVDTAQDAVELCNKGYTLCNYTGGPTVVKDTNGKCRWATEAEVTAAGWSPPDLTHPKIKK